MCVRGAGGGGGGFQPTFTLEGHNSYMGSLWLFLLRGRGGIVRISADSVGVSVRVGVCVGVPRLVAVISLKPIRTMGAIRISVTANAAR